MREWIERMEMDRRESERKKAEYAARRRAQTCGERFDDVSLPQLRSEVQVVPVASSSRFFAQRNETSHTSSSGSDLKHSRLEAFGHTYSNPNRSTQGQAPVSEGIFGRRGISGDGAGHGHSYKAPPTIHTRTRSKTTPAGPSSSIWRPISAADEYFNTNASNYWSEDEDDERTIPGDTSGTIDKYRTYHDSHRVLQDHSFSPPRLPSPTLDFDSPPLPYVSPTRGTRGTSSDDPKGKGKGKEPATSSSSSSSSSGSTDSEKMLASSFDPRSGFHLRPPTNGRPSTPLHPRNAGAEETYPGTPPEEDAVPERAPVWDGTVVGGLPPFEPEFLGKHFDPRDPYRYGRGSRGGRR